MVAKVGRNDRCPCGSGLKYKRCCLVAPKAVAVSGPQKKIISLAGEVEKIQAAAAEKRKMIRELGVFVLFSTENGDGWLLEVTGRDALLLASGGEAKGVEIEVNPETIEINWSHQFTISNKVFQTTSYADDRAERYPEYPTATIAASVKRIRKRYAPELLEGLHVDQ